MTGHELQLGLLSLAFWIALVHYAHASRCLTARFVLGLGLGASLSCIGWWVLQRGAMPSSSVALLSGGAMMLLFPLGPLALCCEPAAIRSLPLALAVARRERRIAGTPLAVLARDFGRSGLDLRRRALSVPGRTG